MVTKNQTFRSLLVLGGAKSGKTAFAQRLAELTGQSALYLATAQAFDAEMVSRIAAHKAERGVQWALREEPFALVEALAAEAKPGRIILVDCTTLWLSNLVLAGHDLGQAELELANLIPNLRGPVIFVSNEVGNAIVPDNALARTFVDAQGRLNQSLAAACDGVVQIVAGLPNWLKPATNLTVTFGSSR